MFNQSMEAAAKNLPLITQAPIEESSPEPEDPPANNGGARFQLASPEQQQPAEVAAPPHQADISTPEVPNQAPAPPPAPPQQQAVQTNLNEVFEEAGQPSPQQQGPTSNIQPSPQSDIINNSPATSVQPRQEQVTDDLSPNVADNQDDQPANTGVDRAQVEDPPSEGPEGAAQPPANTSKSSTGPPSDDGDGDSSDDDDDDEDDDDDDDDDDDNDGEPKSGDNSAPRRATRPPSKGDGQLLGSHQAGSTPEQVYTGINTRGKSFVLSLPRPITSSKRRVGWCGREFIVTELYRTITTLPSTSNSRERTLLETFASWFGLSPDQIVNYDNAIALLAKSTAGGFFQLLDYSVQAIKCERLFASESTAFASPIAIHHDIAGILPNDEDTDRHWCIDRILSQLPKGQRLRLLVFLSTFFIKSYCSKVGELEPYSLDRETQYIGAAVVFIRHYCNRLPLLVALAYYSFLTHRRLEFNVAPNVQPITCNIPEEDYIYLQVVGVSDCEEWPEHWPPNHDLRQGDIERDNKICKSALKLHHDEMQGQGDTAPEPRKELWEKQQEEKQGNKKGKGKARKSSAKRAGGKQGGGGGGQLLGVASGGQEDPGTRAKKLSMKEKKKTKGGSVPAPAVSASSAARSQPQADGGSPDGKEPPAMDWRESFTLDDMDIIATHFPYRFLQYLNIGEPNLYPRVSTFERLRQDKKEAFEQLGQEASIKFSFHFINETSLNWLREVCEAVSKDEVVPKGEAIQGTTIKRNVERLSSLKTTTATAKGDSSNSDSGDDDPPPARSAGVASVQETGCDESSVYGSESDSDEDSEASKTGGPYKTEEGEDEHPPFAPFEQKRDREFQDNKKFYQPVHGRSASTSINTPHGFPKALYGTSHPRTDRAGWFCVQTQHQMRKVNQAEGYQNNHTFNFAIEPADGLVDQVPQTREACTPWVTITNGSNYPKRTAKERDIRVLKDGTLTKDKSYIGKHCKQEGKKNTYLFPPMTTVCVTNIFDTFWNMKCSVHRQGCGAALKVGTIVRIEGEDIIIVTPGVALIGVYVWVDGVRCCKIGLARCLPRHLGMLANAYGVITQVSRRPTPLEKSKKNLSDLFVVSTNGWAELMLMSKGSPIATGNFAKASERISSQEELDKRTKRKKEDDGDEGDTKKKKKKKNKRAEGDGES